MASVGCTEPNRQTNQPKHVPNNRLENHLLLRSRKHRFWSPVSEFAVHCTIRAEGENSNFGEVESRSLTERLKQKRRLLSYSK